MIKPHGSDELNPLFVYDSAENEALQKEAEGLASIVVSSATAANAVMMGAGYFNPLTGYMNKADALSVAKDMKTTSGLFWPTPVLNLVEDAGSIKAGDRIALKDPNVEAILVNIFGGIVRCDIVAQGVIAAAKNVDLKVPVVVRLEGTNAEEGLRLIEESGLKFETAKGLKMAAEKAVAAAGGAS